MNSKRTYVTSVMLTFMLGVALSHGTEQSGNSFIVKTNGTWRADWSYTCDLVILDEDNNNRTVLILSDLYPDQLYKAHVDETTAGPDWGLDSLSFLVNLNSRPHFAMHSWTGHRLLVDLNSACIAEPSKFRKELDTEEERQLTSVITNAAYILSETRKGVPTDKLHGAIVLAARRKLLEVRKYLETIEKHDTWSGPIGWHGNYSYGKGLDEKVRKETYKILENRRFAQLALRRLGLTPLGYSQYVLEKGKESKVIDPTRRRCDALRIKPNSSSQDVYESLGAPDYIMTAVEDDDTKGYAYLKKKWINAWRYDFSSPADFSLIFIWDDNGLVRRIEKVTPALWQGDKLFSDKMPKPVFWADGGMNGIHLYSPEFSGTIDVTNCTGTKTNNLLHRTQ